MENAVALSLHGELCLREDRDGRRRTLCYLRTKEGRETDFAIVEEDALKLMIEVKSRDRKPDPGILYFQQKYGYPSVQLVGDLRTENESGPVAIRRAEKWLKNPLW